jgi:uncharacterized repeat protein (TIGR01451 family)
MMRRVWNARLWQARLWQALALLALSVAIVAPARAQVARTFTPRFNVQTAGDVTLIGNTVMSCSASDSKCANAQSGGGTGNVDNEDFTMQYVDVDGDATTFSSSTATLSLPSGANVLFAGLYWGGFSALSARNTVKLAVPGGAYATVTAQQLDAIGSAYQGFLDVTSQVRAAGSGTYRVANVQSTPGTNDVWGGWSIVVIYHLDTALPRNLTVADGFVFAGPGNNVNLSVSGFLTPPSGTVQASVGIVAYDGDAGHTGEDLILNATTLSDALNPANNVFNSTISLEGTRFSAKNPDYANQLGFDADILAANGVLGNGTTSATVTLKSASDRYYAGGIVFKTQIFVPKFDASSFKKTVVDLNGGGVRPGDVLEYTISARNVGTDAALQTVIRDTLASTLTYVAGSLRVSAGANAGTKTDGAGDDQMEYVAATRSIVARVGTGADATTGGRLDVNASTSIVFRAQVTPPAPTGTSVANQAALACIGAQLGLPQTAVSDGDSTVAGEQPTTVATVSSPITGTVFDDAGYGGGVGRTRTTSGGTAVASARVELYDASGNYQTAVTTDATGVYSLDGWAPGLYTVRVVNSTVTATRPGAIPGLLPVQTFRTDATTGTAVAVTDRVGGETPALADAAANTTSAALATLTTATTTAQSVSPVTLGTTTVSGVDFGFNFDTIVNVNDAGQGSLRQFITNANVLLNNSILQSGFAPGVENALFMISDGLAHPGLRAGLPGLLTGGVARITLASALPALNTPFTRIDGATQTTNVGNTNPALLSGGATVGVDGLTTAVLAGPEVELRGTAAVAVGLDLQSTDLAVANLALNSFGTAVGSDASAVVRVGATGLRATLDKLVLGATATSFADPGVALRARADQVRVLGGDNGTLRDCLIGFGAGSAVALTAGSDGWTIDGCTLLGNTNGNSTLAQVLVAASGTLTATRTLVQGGDGAGIDAATATSGVSLTNLSIRSNGRGAAGATAGARLGGSGGTLSKCVVESNYGAGAQLVSTATTWTLTRNSFNANGTVTTLAGSAASGQIGIDLQSAGDNALTGTAPYVTRNDNADADAGANTLVNFPVLESATVANGQFTISGWARPGSVIEVYVSDGDASGFGEGRTWVTTLTEGSAADLDAGVTAYTNPVNGLNQGTDNTNRFRFTMALPAGVAVGTSLTATGTLAALGTSEFSGVVRVAAGVSLSGTAYVDADHDAQRDAAETGSGLALWAKLVGSGGGAAVQVAPVTAATGAYAFTFVASGTWTVLLDTTSDPNDVTAGYPAGWIGTEHPTGTLQATTNTTDVANQDFGLWHGSRVDGVVFRDDGAGSGVANDGVRTAGESGVSGRRVRLTSGACSGGACDSTLTDGAGAFTLWLPFAATGSVGVQATNSAGWLSTGASAGTTGGSYARASDLLTFTAAAGVAYSGVAFGDVPPNLWAAPGAQGIPGGTAAVYRHTYTAASTGTVSFTSSQVPVPPVSGWGLTLWRDLNCNGVLDAGEPPLPASLALSTGQSVCVIAKHQAPLGAAAGARETATLTASFSYANASPALAASTALADVTTITFANGLVIAKSVDRATAAPGSYLVYTITYSNPGTVPINNIVIRDATPPWTVFDSASCAGAGSGITGCTLTQQPAAGATGTVSWTLAGSLTPGGSGSVSFRVRVN